MRRTKETSPSSLTRARAVGRPSRYCQKLAHVILTRIADGEGLREICRDPAMPDRSTVLRWVQKHDAFRRDYERAREAQIEWFAEEMLNIAFDRTHGDAASSKDGVGKGRDTVAWAKLQIDTMKWLMSKFAPTRFGDRLEVEDGNTEKVERVIILSGNGRSEGRTIGAMHDPRKGEGPTPRPIDLE